MKELISDENRTVIIVSHIRNYKELCDEVLWLHDGKIRKQGSSETVVNEYILPTED